MARKHDKRFVGGDEIPELTSDDFAGAKALKVEMPEVVEAMKRGRGRPALSHPKARVSLRLDPEIIAAYKATGEGWQSRINKILALAIARPKPKRRSRKVA